MHFRHIYLKLLQVYCQDSIPQLPRDPANEWPPVPSVPASGQVRFWHTACLLDGWRRR